MKVLLIQDIDNLGMAGEVKEVTNGYGRNYLIPKGLAVLATPGSLKEADLHRRRARERRERIADEINVLAGAVRQATLVFEAKAGEKGRLYGSVTPADVADKLTETVGQEIDRRKLVMEGPIKQLGTHTVSLRLSADVIADFDVVVESTDVEEPSAELEEPAADLEEPIVETEETLVETEEPLAEE